jgi:uncharacterized protein YjiS (DUF1127 family)
MGGGLSPNAGMATRCADSSRRADGQASQMLGRPWSAINRAFNTFAKGIAETRRLRRAYDELAAMSDPELHDIGINRTDIPAVLWGSYCGTPPRTISLGAAGRKGSPSPGRKDQPGDQKG